MHAQDREVYRPENNGSGKSSFTGFLHGAGQNTGSISREACSPACRGTQSRNAAMAVGVIQLILESAGKGGPIHIILI